MSVTAPLGVEPSSGRYQGPSKAPLNPELYNLQGDELSFFKKATGIDDEEALKKHILDVQARAYEMFGYPCIRIFAFLELWSTRGPGYQEALNLLHTHRDPILLDIGCCFGVDIRKMVADGWPLNRIVGCDLIEGFWNYGHELFRTTPESFPVAFVTGDIFEPTTLVPSSPYLRVAEEGSATGLPQWPTQLEVQDLRTLTSLTPLQGHVSAIHAARLFHLFSEEKQRELAGRLASLLSPEKGSVIFGNHGGRKQKGFREENGANGARYHMFCHSPETWKEMWEVVFLEGGSSVRVETQLCTDGFRPGYELMIWSVTRV